MSEASGSSFRSERGGSDALMEVEAARSLNKYLRTYLHHVQMYKRSIVAFDANLKEMRKVNMKWVDVLRKK